jgi:hypothetical protein
MQPPFVVLRSTAHVKRVLCRHGMVRPRVADGGDGLQIWRVAANVLNKQSRTAEKGWFYRLGVGRWAGNSLPKKISLLRKRSQSLGPGRIPWINDLSERKWISDLVHGMLEVCIGQVRWGQPEVSKYKLDLLGVQKVRWGGGGTEPAGEYTFLYGKGNENHELGTGFSYVRVSYQQLRA